MGSQALQGYLPNSHQTDAANKKIMYDTLFLYRNLFIYLKEQFV
jgi:hypothetical protein